MSVWKRKPKAGQEATRNPAAVDVDRPTPKGAAAAAGAYDRKRDAERDRQAAKSRSGRDIGPIPPVKDAKRRAAAEKSFRKFCESYFPERFTLAWSDDHLKIIARIQNAVVHGGLSAFAMPRGSGKTSLCEVACIWALVAAIDLTGGPARRFVCLIGASAEAAAENLQSIKTEFEANDLLSEDFPEVCFPIQQTEGRANLCAGQHIQGERTHITFGKRVLVLPTVAKSKASGGILRVAGITGRMRGMKFTRADGKSVRPDLVVVDDPQTDASAKSETMCAQREKLLAGAVLGLAGPGQQIAGFMPCTVIRRGDMADNILDRKLHPAWQGERTKLVYAFPTNEKLWDEYAELRAKSLANDGNGAEATKFYKTNRKAMDAGAVVAWPARYRPGELSALQYAMNLRIDDSAAFEAEYQNQPLADASEDSEFLNARQIAAKISGVGRAVAPQFATRLTFYIDVQHRLLYWSMGAWSDDFTGQVIEYGTWPEQTRSHFAYRGVKKTLQSMYPGDLHAAVRAGLADLTEQLLVKRVYSNEAGAELPVEKGLIDAADGQVTDAVFDFCRTSPHRARLMPAIGKGIDASSVPMHAYKVKQGERLGFHWMLQPVPKRGFRQLIIDSNFWKSFVHQRLALPLGNKGALSLFGGKGTDHRLFSEHLTAETRERLKNERSQRSVDVWRLKPAKPDNHWFDCVAGTAVAASLCGAAVNQKTGAPRARPRPQVSF